MSRPVLVVYDVHDDRRRAAVWRTLDQIANCIQQSGWVIPAEASLTALDVMRQLSYLTADGDIARAYAPCPGCRRRARWLPAWAPAPLPDGRSGPWAVG